MLSRQLYQYRQVDTTVATPVFAKGDHINGAGETSQDAEIFFLQFHQFIIGHKAIPPAGRHFVEVCRKSYALAKLLPVHFLYTSLNQNTRFAFVRYADNFSCPKGII